MLQFTPTFFFDEPNLAKKNCLSERALRLITSPPGYELTTKVFLRVFCGAYQSSYRSNSNTLKNESMGVILLEFAHL